MATCTRCKGNEEKKKNCERCYGKGVLPDTPSELAARRAKVRPKPTANIDPKPKAENDLKPKAKNGHKAKGAPTDRPAAQPPRIRQVVASGAAKQDCRYMVTSGKGATTTQTFFLRRKDAIQAGRRRGSQAWMLEENSRPLVWAEQTITQKDTARGASSVLRGSTSKHLKPRLVDNEVWTRIW